MRVLMFGPPGAGKGTQAALLVKRYSLKHISTGNILREVIKAKTETGSIARAYMDEGKLVPDDIIKKLAEKAIADAGFDRFILDGYPRTIEQAHWLGGFLEKNDIILDAIVSLKVPDEVIVQRLSRRRVHAVTGENYHLDFKPPPLDVNPGDIIQRRDDRPETIRERLRVYHKQTKPVEALYINNTNYVKVDGTLELEEIHQMIAGKLTTDKSVQDAAPMEKSE